MSLLTLRLDVPANANLPVANEAISTIKNLQLLLDACESGRLNTTSLRCDVGPVAATDSVAIADAAGAVSITINGVAFSTTADADDTVTAAALATLINASTNAQVKGQVSALAAGADHAAAVLMTAIGSSVGIPGNFITLAAAGTGMTAVSARFTGGLDAIAAAAAVQAAAVFTISSGSGVLTATVAGKAYAVTWATSDTATGDALVALVQAAPPPQFPVTAANASGVVTVTALGPGAFGNSIPVSALGTGFTVATDFMTGGADVVQGTAQVAAAAASDVVTVASASGALTVTINGQTFYRNHATSDTADAAALATAILSHSGILPYVSQTASFTAGAVLTGAKSGATAVIAKDTDNGTTGQLHLQSVVGTFIPGEAIVDNNGSPGAAKVGAQGLLGSVQGLVTASSLAGALTVSAVLSGAAANVITIAVTGTGMTTAHATLVGGADAVNYQFVY